MLTLVRPRYNVNGLIENEDQWGELVTRDKIKKAIADQRYGQSEKGFVGNKWVHLSKPSARRRGKNGKEIKITLTKQTYWLEYLNHKQIMMGKYPESDGKLCRYCEKPFTFKEAVVNVGNKKAKRKSGTIKTNLSVDRLDNNKGYEEGNVIFCCAGCNNRKNQVLIQDCKNILRVYNDRFDNHQTYEMEDKQMTKKKPKLRFTTYDNMMNDELCCPICGLEQTHITDVEVHARHEDAERCKEVRVCGYSGDISIETTNGDKNPSSRRHAIVLKGHCEAGCNFDISFAQHKGATEVNTRLTKAQNFSYNQDAYIESVREHEDRTKH